MDAYDLSNFLHKIWSEMFRGHIPSGTVSTTSSINVPVLIRTNYGDVDISEIKVEGGRVIVCPKKEIQYQD
jgi:hypothetical protein